MNFEPDTSLDASPYVRSDVSVAVLVALIAGVVFAFVYDWTFLTITIAISYMAIGLSTVYEWNKELQAEGNAPRGVFGNGRTAAFLPALVILVSFHFQGFPFGISGTVSLGALVGYLYALYAIGFTGMDSDEVYFKDDPYTGEPLVWREDVYIPRLEAYSVEQAQGDTDASESE